FRITQICCRLYGRRCCPGSTYASGPSIKQKHAMIRHSKNLDNIRLCPYTSSMKNKRLLSPKEAAFELGISIKTVHRWDEAGKLRTVRTAGNQRRIPIEEISRLRRQGEGKQGAERCVLYARVSSGRQEEDGDLARQSERLTAAAMERGYEI